MLQVIKCSVCDKAFKYFSYVSIKLRPAIYALSQHVIRFHELPADTT